MEALPRLEPRRRRARQRPRDAEMLLTAGDDTNNTASFLTPSSRRKVVATASAVLAVCALSTLTDLQFITSQLLSQNQRSISRRLAETTSSATEEEEAKSEELVKVSGVRTALFFLPVEPHLKFNNKMNSHHPLPHYHQGLANTCQFLNKIGHPASLLGDQEYVQSHAKDCAELDTPEEGKYEINDLNHVKGAEMVQQHMCRRKFATDKHDARRILREHVLVYLNKLDVLCDLARRNPTELTVLVDSDLDPELWGTVHSMIERRKKDARDATLTVYEHSDYGYRSWFGRPSCREHPTVNTEFMAIRGNDCPAVQDAFTKTLDTLVESASKVLLLPDAGPCPCYDDEMVMHYLKKDRDDLISFYGVPRAVPGDDDEALFDEDVEHENQFGAIERMMKERGDVEDKEGGEDGDGEEDDNVVEKEE